MVIDPLDLRKIIGLALLFLEALPQRIQAARARIRALSDARRFTATAAQVIKLRPTHLAAPQDLDLGNVR